MRWVTVVGLTLVLALGLPYGARSASPVVATLWNGIGAPDGEVLSAFVKEFNAKYEGKYRIAETVMQWDTLYTKILTDFRAGNPPDVSTFHQPALRQYVTLGVLQDIDALVAKAGIKGGDYATRAWQGTVIDGKRYAVPNDMHPWALYYNRKMFKAAGLPDRGPKNMDEFLSFAKKLTVDTNGDGKIDQWGFGFNYNGAIPHRLLISLLAQKGKSILTPDNKRATLNNADTREVLQFLYDLVYKYKVVAERQTDADVAFKQGHIAMLLDGPWNLLDFKGTAGLDFMTAPIPTFYSKPAAWGSSHVYVMPKSKSPEKLEAAMAFVAFATSKGYDWTSKAGHMPVRAEILKSAQFKQLKEWQAFADSLPFMVYYPSVVPYSKVFSHDPTSPLVKMTESVLLGKASIADAVKAAEQSFNQLLASP